MDDEFEVEVTDLRTGRRVEQAVPMLQPSPSPAPGRGDEAAEPDEADEADEADEPAGQVSGTMVAPRWLRERWANRRTLGAVGTLAALVVVAALVLASVPNSQATLRALLQVPTPTPTATLAPGADTFYATRTVPWGRLLSDGQQLAQFQEPNGTRSFYFTLARGTHTLRYDAPPFPSLTCQVSVPAAPRDTCPLANGPVLIGGSAPGALDERTLDMGTSLDKLPQVELGLLMKAAGGALSQQIGGTQGLAGDHYLADDGTVATAPGPFQAALVYTLNLDANRMAPNMPVDCVTLCDVGGSGPDQGYWPIEAHIVVSWRYTFADGSTATGPGVAPTVAPADTLVELDVTWDGQWQVTLPPHGSQLCEFAFSALNTAGGSTAGTGGQGMSGQAAPWANPADGCFIGLTQMDATGTPQAATAYLLYRFGLLLTVNAQARQMFPMLPPANAHEQALAQQMAQGLYPP